jgi:hypothetical protein
VSFFNGSGSYAGISGTVHVTLSYAEIGPVYKTGAKKGQCNLSNNAVPVAAWSGIVGKGSVKFA